MPERALQSWRQKSAILRQEVLRPFDDPLYRDLLELVFTHVREYFIVIDRDFIYEIGVLYLSIAAQAMIASLKNRFQEE